MADNTDKIKQLYEDFKSSPNNPYKTEEDFRAAFMDQTKKDELYSHLSKEYEYARSDFFKLYDEQHALLKKKGNTDSSKSQPGSQSKSKSTSTSTTTNPFASAQEKEFEKRAKNPNQLSIKNPDGTKSTHKMASAEVDGKFIAYPTIIQRGGGLQQLSDEDAFKYAMETGEYKEFNTEEEAQVYAEGGYKKGTALETPYTKSIADFNRKYGTVYTKEEFQGKDITPDQKAMQILNMVADNVAQTQNVPKLKDVIAKKIERQSKYLSASQIGEEEQEQYAQQEYDAWIKSKEGAAVYEQAKSQVQKKAQEGAQAIQQAFANGQVSKAAAEAQLAKINDASTAELNAIINQEWVKKWESGIKDKLEKKLTQLQEERFKKAVAQDNVLSARAQYTIKSIANSDKFREMNFQDKKRVIAASWDGVRVALEKRGYDKDFINKYKEQYMSEFVYAASRTPKGDVTSYGVREWAADALKEIEVEKAELEKTKAPESGLSMNIGGMGAVPVVTDERYNKEAATLMQAEEQIKSTLARPELAGGDFFSGLGYGFKYGQNIPVPYVKSAIELVNNMNAYRIAQKVKEGKELNDGEKLLLHSLGMDQAYKADAKPSFGFEAGEAATVSIPYMVDMAAGNWAAAPARTAVKEAILKAGSKYAEKAIFKYGVAQPISVIVGEMARTAADPIKWGKDFIDHMNPAVKFAFGMDVDTEKEKAQGNYVVPIDEMVALLDNSTTDILGQKTGKGMDPIEAFAMSFLDNLKENVSERIGGALGGEVGEALVRSLAKNNEWAKRLIISAMLRKNGGMTPTAFQKTMKELKSATGLDGIIGENIEEYAAALAEDFMYDRAAGTSFTEDFFKQTLAVTAAIQVPMQAIGLGAKFIQGPKDYAINYRDQTGEIKEVVIPLEVAQQAFGQKGKVASAEWLFQELGKTKLTPEQRLAVFQNVQSKMYWDEVSKQSEYLFGARYSALNEEKKKQVRDVAYSAVKPFLQTRDEIMLQKLKREDNIPTSKEQETTEEGKTPPAAEPGESVGAPSNEPGSEPAPLTIEDDPEGQDLGEDPEIILNEIAGKIEMGLDLTPDELKIVLDNRDWFVDIFDGDESKLPKPPKPTGLGQELDEEEQAVMNQYRDAYLEDIGVTLDQFNAMSPEDKKKIEEGYIKYLNDLQDVGEEMYVKQRDGKSQKPKAPFIPETDDDFLAEELQGQRLKMDQLYRMFGKDFFDTGRKGQGYAINWGTKKDSGSALDQIAHAMANDEKSRFFGMDEQRIAQLIGDFIVANPGGAAAYINRRVREKELENDIDREQLEKPELLDQIDEFVNNFSDEEVDEMILWLSQSENLDSVEKAIDEWLDGDPFSDFGAFVNFFTDKFNPSKEGVNIQQPALAKRLKQLIDEKRRKQNEAKPADEPGETPDDAEKDGDGQGQEEEQGPKVGDFVNWEGEQRKVIAITKMGNENKYNIELPDGKNIWTNLAAIKKADEINPDRSKSDLSTGPSKEYKYELRARPFGIGTYPKKDSFLRFEDARPGDRRSFGFVVYNQPLTNKEWNDYELAPTTMMEEVEGKQYQDEYYGLITAKILNGMPSHFQVEMRQPADNPSSDFVNSMTMSAKEFFTNIETGYYTEKKVEPKPANKKTAAKKPMSGPSIDGIDLDDFDMSGLDSLSEMDLFGNDPAFKGKSDFRKDYEKQLAEAKKELKAASADIEKTKADARKRGDVSASTLEQILRPKMVRYQMALKQLDIIRSQEKNVKDGEDAQQTLFEGNVGDYLKKELTPEQMAAGKKFIQQFFDKGVYDFPRIAQIIRVKAGPDALYDKLPALVKVYSAEMISVDDEIAEKMSGRAEVRGYVENFITELNTQEDDTTDNGEGGQDGPDANQGGSGDGGTGQGAGPNSPSGPGTGGGSAGGTSSSSGSGGNTNAPSGNAGGQGNNTGGGNSGGGARNTGDGNAPNNTGANTKGQDDNGNTPSPKLTFQQKRELQNAAEPIPIITADKENIENTVPFALPSQMEDTFRAENALFVQNKKGILFTNGTGTGKTSTALSIVKRFIKEGRQDGYQVYVNNRPVRRFQVEKDANEYADTLRNETDKVEVKDDFGKERRVLILTPKQSINNKFVNEASWFNMNAYNLDNTKDTGDGYNVVVTTHANFRENENVQNQDWDMIVVDESDQIMSSQAGKQTSAVDALRVAAKHYSKTKAIAQSRIGSPELQRLNEEIETLEKEMATAAIDIREMMQGAIGELKQLRDAERKKYDKIIQAEADRLSTLTKVIFMSATPFASSPALDYAEGFLFDYPKDRNGQRSQTDFMAQNFAWRVNDWGKVKDKSGGAGVDQGFLEREFHEKLKNEGVLFTRVLDSEYDYSRDFVVFLDPEGEQGIGRTIDRGIQILQSDEFKLRDLVNKKFNFLYTMRLLEAYKAKMSIPLMTRLLSEGKKIVVFHNYNQGAPSHPFDFTPEDIALAAGSNLNRRLQIESKIKDFHDKYPEFRSLDMSGLINPIQTISEAFPNESLVFNGSVAKSKRAKIINEFNESTDKNIIIVQKEAGKAGIDLHDQLGNAQRVTINMGIPIMSNDAIQPEGRTFRVGNRSNAVFIYPAIHTNFERFIWSDKSAPRAGTSENFALGNEARGMEETLRTGYLDAITLEEFYQKLDSGNYGVGGKDFDKRLNQITAYEKAIQHYHLRQKRSRNREPEGVDYYPTPEPLGFKMVEWADIKPGQEVLEPSAGSGSIARYIPELTTLDIIEPSNDLRSQAAMLVHKNANHFGDRFEDVSIVNKYDRIVMNPPFGFAGKTAMEHLAKAFQHLRDGGRVVALVPQGKMDERLRNFLYGENAPEDAVLRAVIKLPPVTFEKAGTNVNTQIVVIDRIKDKDVREKVAAMGGSNLGAPNDRLRSVDTIKELFDEIEEMSVPPTIDMNEGSASNSTSSPTPATQSFEMIKNYHAKEKRDNWVVKINGRLSNERYAEANAKAKQLGGNYSSYKQQGAIPGFQFKTEEAAKEFLEWANGGPQLQKESVDFPLTPKEIEFRNNLTTALSNTFEGIVNEVVVAPSTQWGVLDTARFVAFEKPSTGEVLGAFYQDKVFIDPRVARPETPIHEFGHAFTKLLGNNRPEVLERGLELIQSVQGLFYIEQVEDNPAYANLTPRQKQEEALVRAIADRGVYMASNQKKGFQAWLKEFWQAIKDIVGLDKVSASDLAKMDLDAYTTAAVKTMFTKAAIRDIAQDRTAKNIVAQWYSRLEDVVSRKGNAMTGEQWAKWAEARANEGLLDREELFWTGISDYWEENKFTKLPVPEVMNYLKNNRVEIAEKVLEEKGVETDAQTKKVNGLKLWFSERLLTPYWHENQVVVILNSAGYDIDIDIVERIYDEGLEGDELIKELESAGLDGFDTLDEVKEFLSRYEELNTEWSALQNPDLDYDEEGAINKTRLYYTSPNLRNKKEIVLYVEGPSVENLYHIVRDTKIKPALSSLGLLESEDAMRRMMAYNKEGRSKEFESDPDYPLAVKAFSALNENGFGEIVKEYKKSFTIDKVKPYNPKDEIHFGTITDGRALVWIRFGENETESGERIMVIDEIQSTRHEEGRDQGYEGQFFVTKMNGDKIEGSPTFSSPEDANDWALNQQELSNQAYRVKEGKTPIAPFKKTYTDLAVKRALRYAVENGYDYLVWNTGEQATQRFSLGSVIDSISYEKLPNGKYAMGAYRGLNSSSVLPDELNESGHYGVPQMTLSRIKEYFGSEVANAVENDKGEPRNPMFPSVKYIKADQVTNSEPMKKYYGSVKEGRIGDVGKAAEKIAKKFDPTIKVAPVEVEIDVSSGFTSGMGIRITPALYEAMSEKGLPLMQIETPKQRALNELKKEWEKYQTIGITPNQSDPGGLSLLAKAIKYLYHASKEGAINLVKLAAEVGGNSIELLRQAHSRLKNWADLENGNIALAVFDPKSSKEIATALAAASMMDSKTAKEFRDNMKALKAATNDKAAHKVFDYLGEMAGSDLEGAKSFVRESAGVKPNVQIAVNRNGVPHYVYNDKAGSNLTLEHFSLSKRIKDALNRIGVPVREKRIPRALGQYWVAQKYVKVRSMMEIFTAIHEGMHHVDNINNISDSIMSGFRANSTLIEDLKGIYQEFYANAKPSHPTKLQVIEGLAVLMNEYLGQPHYIEQKYPTAVDMVLRPGGAYNVPLINQLLSEMQDIYIDALKVNPIYRTGLRLADMQQKIRNSAQNRQHTWAKLLPSMLGGGMIGAKRYAALQIDVSSMWQELDRLADVAYTKDSVDQSYFTVLQAAPIAQAWLNGKQPMAVLRQDGNYDYHDLSVAKVLSELNSIAKAKNWTPEYTRELFNQYLINRRALGDYNRMVDAKNDYDMYMANFPDPNALTPIQQAIKMQLWNKYVKLRAIVNNDNFDIRDVGFAVSTFEPVFVKPTEIFDKINQQMLIFSKNTGLISNAAFIEWSANKDYASFQRFFYDDLMGGGGAGTGNLGQFKLRKGSSEYTFLGSLEAMILQIPQTVIKGYQNTFWVKFAKFVEDHGENFGINKAQLNQEFIRIPKTPRMINGQPDFSHLFNRVGKGVITFRVNGSNQFYEIEPWIEALATTLSPETIDSIQEKVALAASNIFGQMTTSSNPFFALQNLFVDQISSLVNTKTKKVFPVLSEIKEVAKEWKAVLSILGLRMSNPTAYEKLQKYLALAGDRNTLAASYGREETVGDIIARAVPRKDARYVAKRAVKGVLDILSAPVNAAEILTRFGEFSRAIDMGYDESTALYLSAHISAPFYRKGMYGSKAGRVAYKSNPYWNASVAAFKKLIQSSKEDPKRVAAITGTFAFIAANSALSVFVGGGDDDAIAEMANRPVEDFSKYIFVWSGDSWIRVRVPEPLTSVTGPAQMFAFQLGYQMYKDKDFSYAPSQYFQPAISGLPGGFKQAEGMIEGVATADAKKFAANALEVLPQSVEPAIKTALGVKTWPTITPIVTGKYAKYENQYQANKYTSDFAKWMGEHLDVSPMKVDFFLKEQLGTNAKFLLENNSEADRPFYVSPWRFNSERVWSRGREYGLFLQQIQEIEKHKNSIVPSLVKKGVDMVDVERMFHDDDLTPSDFVKTANYKKFKKAYPEYAEEVKETYEAWQDSKAMAQLTFAVNDMADNKIMPDQLKLSYFELIYKFNRQYPGVREEAVALIKDMKKRIPNMSPENIEDLNKALHKFKK